MNEKLNLTFSAEVEANVDKVKNVVAELKRQLSTLSLPASATKGFERRLGKLSDELVNFEALSSRGMSSLSDTKKATASWDKISQLMN